MVIVFVHGWGVRRPDYGPLPERIRAACHAATLDIWLADYISFSDAVTMTDLALAFERARLANFPNAQFACITHSTGGPVIRTWLDLLYRDRECPLTHLIMLAPPNHGSALAQLGKSRLARMKLWFDGVEPGERILDWLELGSPQSWDLNVRWARDSWTARGVRTAVFTGSGIDRKLYDHLNSYTGERGSDGVVRAAAANLNFSVLRLAQNAGVLTQTEFLRNEPNFFALFPAASHSGIMSLPETAPLAARFLSEANLALSEANSAASEAICSMIVVRVIDSAGGPVTGFDLLLTAGPRYSPDRLPRGFFIDRQRNSRAPNIITYYFNYSAMSRCRELGFRIVPRPDSGPVRFAPAEYRGLNPLRPHETLMVEIVCQRLTEDRLFRTVREES